MRFPFISPTTAPRTGLRKPWHGGFTLVEMLVAILILVMIMALVFTMTDQTGKIWKRTTTQIQSFEEARAAYSTMTTRLRQATLNTYLDYYDATGNQRVAANAQTFAPSYYARASDLHFVVDQASTIVPNLPSIANAHPGHAVFFQAPLGFTLNSSSTLNNKTTNIYSCYNLPNLLNACGYYIEFNTDKLSYPPFVSTVQDRYRYRLMEFLQPTENLSIFNLSSAAPASNYEKWFSGFLYPNVTQTLANGNLRILGENIIALVILPELSPRDQTSATPTNLVSNTYTYDSRAGNGSMAGINGANALTHAQLPPLLRVVMVAIDEPSAKRLNPNSSSTAPPALLSQFTTGGGTPLFATTASADPNADINTDLATLTQALGAAHVNYRVFDTDIAIRGAKWSTQ